MKTIHSKSDLSSLQDLVKSGALSRGLIKQLVASASITLKDAAGQWSKWLQDTAGSDRTFICHTSYVEMWAARAKLGNKKLSEITEAHLSDFINVKDGTKLGTKRARLSALRSFFRFCTIRQWLSYDPSREVRIKAKLLTHEQKEPTVKLCFTDDEIQAIDDYLLMEAIEVMSRMAAIEADSISLGKSIPSLKKKIEAVTVKIDAHIPHPPKILKLLKKRRDYLQRRVVWTERKIARNKVQIEYSSERLSIAQFWRSATGIGRYSGLRLGDICCLEKASLKEHGKLIVWTDKKDSRVELPISDKLAQSISLMPHSNDKRFCFPEQAMIHGDPVKRSKLSVQFTRILEGCKIEGKSFHCLRKTLATELNSQGETIEEIAKALGHSSIETTRIYIASPTETTDANLPR